MACIKMIGSLVLVALIVLALSSTTEAGYRKPPFNGSIFGKRNGNSIGKLDFSEQTILVLI